MWEINILFNDDFKYSCLLLRPKNDYITFSESISSVMTAGNMKTSRIQGTPWWEVRARLGFTIITILGFEITWWWSSLSPCDFRAPIRCMPHAGSNLVHQLKSNHKTRRTCKPSGWLASSTVLWMPMSVGRPSQVQTEITQQLLCWMDCQDILYRNPCCKRLVFT